MVSNYDETNEINEIVKCLTSLPSYHGYQYDEELGFYRGPQSENNSIMQLKLTKNEAIIGIKEPITRLAQHHLLLVEKEDYSNWKLKKTLRISEG